MRAEAGGGNFPRAYRLGGDRLSFRVRNGRGGFLRAPAWALVFVLLLLGLAASPASGVGSAGLKREKTVTVKAAPVAAGLYHGLALTSTGAVFAWGWNIVGQLGDGSTTDSDVPVKVNLPVGTKVTAVAAGAEHNLAVTSTGAVLAWGYNADGQLGDGSTGASDVPVKVSLATGTKVTAVAAGALHSLALTSTGAVLAWANGDGELGDGNRTTATSGEGEPAPRHEGDRDRRRRLLQLGGDLDRGARLGL